MKTVKTSLNSPHTCSLLNNPLQKRVPLAGFSILIFSALLFCCTIDPFHPDTKVLSIDPSLYLPPSQSSLWICEYFDSKGNVIEIPLENLFEILTIEYPVNTVFPLRFRLTDSCSASQKYLNTIHLGLIVPFSQDMKIEDSAACDIFFTIIKGSYNSAEQSMLYCSCFNWEKLIISLSKYEDPYALDLDAAAEDIARGRFTSKSLKKRLP